MAASTKKLIGFSISGRKAIEPITIGKIDGPIRILPILSHGKPAIIIPASIARYFGFSKNWDWLAFDCQIVERGILLTIRNRYADNNERDCKAGDRAIPPATRPIDGELLQLANTTNSALSIVESSQQRKPLIVIENGSSCNTTGLERKR